MIVILVKDVWDRCPQRYENFKTGVTEMIENMQKANPNMKILPVEDASFGKYGQVITGYDFSDYINYMKANTPVPKDGNIYIPSDEKMEAFAVTKEVSANFYGEMPVQVGYCNGSTLSLEALEYHKGSEIDLVVTDLVVLLGSITDIKNNVYDSAKVEAFYIKAGTAVEFYGPTLHFAPCMVDDNGYQCVVVLPRDTNFPLDNAVSAKNNEDKLLLMKNKWVIAHPDSAMAKESGAYAGITGENLKLSIG